MGGTSDPYPETKMARTLIIGDMHAPYTHRHYLEFCQRIRDKWKCNRVVNIGDEVDNHAMSYHEHDPDGQSAGDEAKLAQDELQRWFKAFPRVSVCIGNHSHLHMRQALTAGIPRKFMRTHAEAWRAPKGWRWDEEHEIDGVLYIHGTGFGGDTGHLKAAKEHRQSIVMGHAHAHAGLLWSACRHDLIFGMNVGCVDAATEYLSPSGWVPISQYDGGLVGQYDQGVMTWVPPIAYIKLPCSEFFHVKSDYGINQALSAEHRVAYISPSSMNKPDWRKRFLFITAEEMVKRHNESAIGFQGRFVSTFSTASPGLMLTDAQLRLMVAVIADGSITNKNTGRVSIAVKKQRKIDRIKMLLLHCGIESTESTYANGVTSIRFVPPMKLDDKRFGPQFWLASEAQLKVIAEEAMLWDGDQKNSFFSAKKCDADLVQFALAATGTRASLINERDGTYRVIASREKFFGTITSKTPQPIETIESPDGFKYCFTVPSGMLVLRRGGRIFVTGNCGIDIPAYAFAYGKHLPRRPILACGVVLDGFAAVVEPMIFKNKRLRRPMVAVPRR